MKKFISVLLVLMLITSSASAAGFKFTKLKLKDFTDEELCQMIDACNEKLRQHGFRYSADGPVPADAEPIDLYAGQYIVGQDIPAGTYRIEFHKFYGTVSFGITGEKNYGMYVFSSNDEAIIGKQPMYDGDIILLDMGATFYPY